jgi:hypothetical protein
MTVQNNNINKIKDQSLERVKTILQGIDSGKELVELRSIFLSAPNKKEIVTEHGTFIGWRDFVNKKGLNYQTVLKHIFLYNHRKELEELKLLSTDPLDLIKGISGQKVPTVKILKWYLNKISIEGESIRGSLTVLDYLQDLESVKKVNSNILSKKYLQENKYVLKSDYDKLLEDYNKLKVEFNVLKYRLKDS